MKKYLQLILLLVFSSQLFSQSGSLDNTFNTALNNGLVLNTNLQPDGKILVAGRFELYNNISRNNILRVNTDGTLDTTFNPNNGFDSQTHITAVQPDGKILVVGYFANYNGISRNRIARLNADGSLDTSFDPGTGANDIINSIILLSDGKILIGGYFTSYNGTSRNRIARLNSNGTLDTSFNPGTGANSNIHDVILQPDGKILIAGDFSSYNDISTRSVARLNANGTFDNSFNGSASNTVASIALQSDGKIIIAGYFTTYSQTPRNRIARLNSNGTLDTSFNPGAGANGTVYSVALQSNGKVIVGGDFTSYNDTAISRLVRVNTDGSLDNTFNIGAGANSIILCITLQPDNKILIGGAFYSYNGSPKDGLARLNNETILGVNDLISNNISLYPNPVKDILHIQNTGDTRASIYNMAGSLIKTLKLSNGINKIDTEILEKGNYFLIVGEGSNQKSFPIIKQ